MSTIGVRSSLPGASWVERLGKWRSKITFNYDTIHLGYFDTDGEASKVFLERYKLIHSKEYGSKKRFV